MLNVIVAYSKRRGIGLSNRLPWKLKADMRRFKELTIGRGNNAVIMGRTTWESLPDRTRPLPLRKNVVVSSLMRGSLRDDCHVARSFQEAKQFCYGEKFDSIWIIGGGHLYREALTDPDVDGVYVTNICNDFTCDTFFPDISNDFYLNAFSWWKKEDQLDYRFEFYSPRSSFLKALDSQRHPSRILGVG